MRETCLKTKDPQELSRGPSFARPPFLLAYSEAFLAVCDALNLLGEDDPEVQGAECVPIPCRPPPHPPWKRPPEITRPSSPPSPPRPPADRPVRRAAGGDRDALCALN